MKNFKEKLMDLKVSKPHALRINSLVSHCFTDSWAEMLGVYSPLSPDFSPIANIRFDDYEAADKKIQKAHDAAEYWKNIPAPKRGELIQKFAEQLRSSKELLATTISVECGKTINESLGEVQEAIDICDFAVGLSRQLYGLTIASERPEHTLMEKWHPLGTVAVISAFNFPVAVWAWNFAIAIVCGNSVVWKASEKTPLSAIMCKALFDLVCHTGNKNDALVRDLNQVIIGGKELGEKITSDYRIKLVSATGSCKMGEAVGVGVQRRFGKCLLELGGNNAMIVTKNADVDRAVEAAVFSAVATTGQRCTSLRRLFVHADVYEAFTTKLQKSYVQSVWPNVGHPLEKSTMVGPLIDLAASEKMQATLKKAQQEGGKILFGGNLMVDLVLPPPYVYPTVVAMEKQTPVVKEETFAPVLFIMKYHTLKEAIRLQNDVPQGLSSSIFTNDMREAMIFLSENGSDCGIANVNVGTCGAEIGGAFGGEKATGGGREAGSDAWKNYMRRQTCTLNYSSEKPQLAQGIKFDV